MNRTDMTTYFPGGGDMGALMRAHDWGDTTMGSPATWPAALHDALNLVLNSPESMYVVWGPGLTFFFNDAYRPILGPRLDGALGQRFETLWADAWPTVREPFELAMKGTASSFEDMPISMSRYGVEEATWWTFSYSPIYAGDRIEGVLCFTRETTRKVLAAQAVTEANAKLADREVFLSSVLAASTDCIKVLDLEGRLTFMSEGGMNVMEVSDFNKIDGCPWPSFLKGSGADLARRAIESAIKGESTHFEVAADTFAGTPKWWSVSVSPIAGADGVIANILAVSRDHTELHHAHLRQRMLNAELGHRLKNILMLVQSIASQTLRQKETVSDAAEAISARLSALGHATDVLTATEWQSAHLSDVLEAGLASVADFRTRISLDGPEVKLNAQSALALTLAMHELATNATKYGALSNQEGTVAISWTVSGRSGAPRWLLDWKETGGPPVMPPTRKGFGSRMIERALNSYFQGETSLQFAPSGVTFNIDAPIGDGVELAKV